MRLPPNNAFLAKPSPPVGGRPDWVHVSRSAPAFWTPSALVLALTVILLLFWPRGPHRSTQLRSMPEASAAYVRISGPRGMLPDPSTLDSAWRHAAPLDESEGIAPRRLPMPVYLETDTLGRWSPVALDPQPVRLPDLAAWPVSPLLKASAPVTNGIAVALSPALLQIGFHFDVPTGVITGQSASVRFHVEVDSAGRVVHLLSEPSENPSGARQIESALFLGRASRAGSGQVQVSWGR